LEINQLNNKNMKKAFSKQGKEEKPPLHKREAQLSERILKKIESKIKTGGNEIHHHKHLFQTLEFLRRLKAELEKLNRLIETPQAKTELKKIIALLEEQSHLNEQRDHFMQHFEQIFSNFYRRLKKEYPKLTAKDQKLCAYLRMNLTSKDIAPLMNISVRGVEISRYRLRKKLDMDTEVNLNEFMMEF